MASGETSNIVDELAKLGKDDFAPPSTPDEPFDKHRFKQKIIDTVTPSTESVRAHADDVIAGIEKAEQLERKIPSHEQISRVFEGATSETRIQIENALITKAFALNGFNSFQLGKAEQFGPDGPDFDSHRADFAPTIYFKPVYEKTGIFSKEAKITDEVVVVIDFHNAPPESTVVSALMKQEKGKLKFSPQGPNPGLYTVKSESEVKAQYSDADTSLDARLVQGKLKIDQYKKEFGRWWRGHGMSLEDYWKDQDKRIENSPDHWKSNEYKEGLMKALGTEYTNLLQEVRTNSADIIKQIEGKVSEAKAVEARVIGSATDFIAKFSGLNVPDLRARVLRDLNRIYSGEFTADEIADIVDKRLNF